MGNTKKKECSEKYNDAPKIPRHLLVEYNRNVDNYRKTQRVYLMTSRFDSDTWVENMQYRLLSPNVGCVYCSPIEISRKILPDFPLIVLEMNNSENKIMGLGLIRNQPIRGKYLVYDKMLYNRCVYIGKIRIDREDMDDEEKEIMRFFDTVCFRGAHHMKRGVGITAFPLGILYRCSAVFDLMEFIRGMFKKRMEKPAVCKK